MKQIYFAAFAANLGMCSIGQFYGWASPTLPKLINGTDEYPVHLTTDEASWIASVFMLGASVGAVVCALVVNIIGRKNTILFIAVPSIISWLMIIFATSPWELYMSRFICGIGVGLAYTTVPIYLGEVSPSEIRGNLATMMGVTVCIGVLTQYVIGPFLSVKNLALVSLVAPCLFVITFIWVPESPYYLTRKNAQQKAIDSLVKLRGTKHVYKEADSIEQSVKADLAIKSSFRDLLIPINLRVLTIMTCLSIIQQASGILPVISYSETIFNDGKSSLDGKYLTMIVGTVQLICAVVCTSVTDRFGRKSLLLISCVGVWCTTSLIATYFTLQYYHMDTSDFTWLLAAGVILYMVSHSSGLTPLLPTLSSEVFPMNIKAFGNMMVLLSATLISFVVTILYPMLAKNYGAYVPMWIFSAFGFLGVLCTYFYLPETKGKTLEEIQKEFAKSSKK